MRQVLLLTGSEVKGQGEINLSELSKVLEQDSKTLDWSQFNELLLLVHKDRVEKPFFDRFFGECTIGSIADGVARFQLAALRLYGNFVFAYRKLSRAKEPDFSQLLAEVTADPYSVLQQYRERQPKLIDIDKIPRDLTPYIGYISAQAIPQDKESCTLLLTAAEEVAAGSEWQPYLAEIEYLSSPNALGPLLQIVGSYRGIHAEATVAHFQKFLSQSLDDLSAKEFEVSQVRKRGTNNQDIYLTWDCMDVYFATSMRKAWEYKDLFNFIDGLMETGTFDDLNLRFFDPTQAYTQNRINKGLVEALMLKRARCTVYSVQDTDTLGKDSELASTLAQGKPVIAYVPSVPVESRTAELAAEDPVTILERLRFVLYADEQFVNRLSDDDIDLVRQTNERLEDFSSKRIWISLPDEDLAEKFRQTLGNDLVSFCRLIADSERVIYDKRARTLKDSHPLGIQVNLASGVANGVLVVRTVDECANLLRRILLSDMDFDLEESTGMWFLREKISGCIYRVVTNDRKLNNSFWNFYLR